MRIQFWSLVALLVVFPLPGNGQSIQPFYTAKDVVFKQELLGKWDLGVPLEFRDAGNDTYGINLFGDEGFVMHYQAHLIHIGQNYFLDVQTTAMEGPEKVTEKGSVKVQMGKEGPNEHYTLDKNDIFLNRHHGLILIEFTKNSDEFIGHLWEDSWLPQMAEKNKMHCPYVKDEMGRILLTGSSSQLRAFVEKLPLSAFDAGHTLTRIKTEEETNVAP